MAQLTQVSSKAWGYVNAMPPWGRKHLPGAGVGEVESVKGEERPAWHGQSAPSIPKSRLSPDFSEESVTHVTSIHSWLTVLLVTTAAFKRKCILQLCRQDLLGLKWGSSSTVHCQYPQCRFRKICWRSWKVRVNDTGPETGTGTF